MCMLHEIVNECNARLAAAGCPVQVEDGPYAEETTWGKERIVLSHDTGGGDSFGPPIGARGNPHMALSMEVGFVARVYAKSGRRGALYFEHVRRAYKIVHAFSIAITNVCRARKQACTLQGGRIVQVVDLNKSFNDAGVVYEITGRIGMAVFDAKWDGEGNEEITVGADLIKTTAYASAQGGDPTDSNNDGVPDNAENVWTEE